LLVSPVAGKAARFAYGNTSSTNDTAYQILADFADQLDTTPEDMAELATNMLCQFEELREFAAGLVAG